MKTITAEEIQRKLQEAIKNSGKSQKEIADFLHIDPSGIAHYMMGDKLPSLDTFANLCVIIETSPADILSYPNEPLEIVKR